MKAKSPEEEEPIKAKTPQEEEMKPKAPEEEEPVQAKCNCGGSCGSCSGGEKQEPTTSSIQAKAHAETSATNHEIPSSKRSAVDSAVVQAKNMTSRAIDVISQARTTMDDGSDALDAYQRWFGPIDMQNSLIVLNVFRSIYQNLSSSSLQFQYNHSKNLYAYVYSGTSNLQVWLCKYFWSKAGNSGINSRGGILIHELAHYARQQIGDYQYGTQKSQKLAFDSDVAIYNADNYQFFAESL